MRPETVLEDITITRQIWDDLARTSGAVVLRRCDLEELDMSDLSATAWRFERCNLSRSRVNGALLEDVSFLNCRASNASFVGATLRETTIDGGDFGNVQFRGASLSAVTFQNCKMTGADLTETRALDVVFRDTLLVLANLKKFSFRKARLDGVDLREADLTGCDFREAVFTGCSLHDAQITDCRFEDADLRGADIGGIKLTDARRFKGAAISKRQAGELLAQLGLTVV